ncbi:MAG: putative hydrolase YxeP [candidate division WS2 bacterium]|nr:putative hydrolase YxeP [Candidatus Lithacetigena glycinireducens]
MITELKEIVDQIYPQLVEYRRFFHTYPELGTLEFDTSEFIQKKLTDWSIPYVKVFNTGIVAHIEGIKASGDKPKVIGIRADMDALPIEEENEVSYRSKYPGIMHACGHDGHMAILLGLAQLLIERERNFAGKVVLIFQPNEEGLGGAKPMIEEYDFSDIDLFFGFHLDNLYPTGTIGIKSGYFSGNTDDLEITIIGKGGHAAYPHLGIDPVVTAASLIQNLQLVVSRLTDPFEPVALTFGKISGGSKHNIIPPEVKLLGTLRTMNDEVRAKSLEKVRDICQGISLASGAHIDIKHTPGYPSIYNDPQLSSEVFDYLKDIFGKEKVVEANLGLGGEDFAYFCKISPALYYLIGSAFTDKERVFPHHHPRFDIDEESLRIGLYSISSILFNYLE